MKPFPSLRKIGLRLLVFSLGLLLCQTLSAAVTFANAPTAVSNTYSGAITLQIGGLTNRETVVIQKFLDVDMNGVLDGGDLLVQQFNLTDGTNFVIGGVTNLNVPGDLNATTGAISAVLNFQNGDFMQNAIGKYLFKLSSPVGHFGPVTNLFDVTNFPYAQQFTGNVVNSGTNVPNAIIVLFGPPRPGDGPGNPEAVALANSSGGYAIKAPPGTYVPVAFRSDFVSSFVSPPVLTLTGGTTINTNLTLDAATQTISGTLVDADNPGIGLPGIFLPVQANGVIGIAFSDANGNFTVHVNDGIWEVNAEGTSLIVHGYVRKQNGTNVTAGDAGVVIPISKATTMFYGTVKDNLGNPLVGVDVFAQAGDNEYETDGHTDQNGNYFAGALAGTWQVQVDSGGDSSSPTNYIFSQGLNQNGGTNLLAGQAVLWNFTAILATNRISGRVQDNNGNPVTGVGVSAYAFINGKDYGTTQVDTDDGGNYSFGATAGLWSVYVNCCGDGGLENQGLYDPNPHSVTIPPANAVVNITVYPTGTPFLSQPARFGSSVFGFGLSGSSGSNYTILVSTNLSLNDWTTVLVTNLPGNFIYFQDNQATGRQRYYRVQLGP
jgi:hypothetical protein